MAVQPQTGPLHGYTVVELSAGIAGAYCTKLLADGGARVVKIESPQGDPLRRWSASGARIEPGSDGIAGLRPPRKTSTGQPMSMSLVGLTAGSRSRWRMTRNGPGCARHWVGHRGRWIPRCAKEQAAENSTT